MPIIKTPPVVCQHPGKPDMKDHALGTIWECDNPNCRQYFRLISGGHSHTKSWELIYGICGGMSSELKWTPT